MSCPSVRQGFFRNAALIIVVKMLPLSTPSCLESALLIRKERKSTIRSSKVRYISGLVCIENGTLTYCSGFLNRGKVSETTGGTENANPLPAHGFIEEVVDEPAAEEKKEIGSPPTEGGAKSAPIDLTQ